MSQTAPRPAPAGDVPRSAPHDFFERLLRRCAALPALRTAVCHPCSAEALAGALEASDAGLIEPLLVGPGTRIRELAAAGGRDPDALTILEAGDEAAAAAASVALCVSGEAAALMKGSLRSDLLLHAVLAEPALRRAHRVSHAFVVDVPRYGRPLLVTDAVVNIAPSLEDKAAIVQNVIDFARVLGIARPQVALLSAVETVEPKLRSTLDAAALCKMADRGQIRGGVLDGPLALDTAVSPHAAAVKQLNSPVAGQADVLVAPDVEAANILVKELEYLGGAQLAGLVLGTHVPVVLTSRADGVQARLLSAALAVVQATAQR